jgi:hypothetical protein
MKKHFTFFFVVWLLCFPFIIYGSNDLTLKIRYDNPASDWESEALPLGNGFIGAMIFVMFLQMLFK